MLFGLTQTRLVAYVVAAAVVAATLGGIFAAGRKAGIAHDAKRSAPIIAGLERDVALCRSDVDKLTLSLERQNSAVAALQAESDERTRRAAEAIREAQRLAQTYRAKADRLARAAPTGDMCSAARSLIIESLSEDRP